MPSPTSFSARATSSARRRREPWSAARRASVAASSVVATASSSVGPLQLRVELLPLGGQRPERLAHARDSAPHEPDGLGKPSQDVELARDDVVSPFQLARVPKQIRFGLRGHGASVASTLEGAGSVPSSRARTLVV